jgi:hypothetical protein
VEPVLFTSTEMRISLRPEAMPAVNDACHVVPLKIMFPLLDPAL